MTYNLETKEERIARQAKQHRQWLKLIKLDCEASRKRKVQHDAYYQKIDFKEEVTIIS